MGMMHEWANGRAGVLARCRVAVMAVARGGGGGPVTRIADWHDDAATRRSHLVPIHLSPTSPAPPRPCGPPAVRPPISRPPASVLFPETVYTYSNLALLVRARPVCCLSVCLSLSLSRSLFGRGAASLIFRFYYYGIGFLSFRLKCCELLGGA